MKTLAVIDGLCSGVWRPGDKRGGISRELLERLCAIYPEGRTGNQGHCFRCALPVEHPITLEVLGILEQEGMRPWRSPERKLDEHFMLDLRRAYDEADFEASEYLQIWPVKKSKGLYRTDQPRPQRGMIAMESPAKHQISYHFRETWVIIRDDARKILEGAGLRGLKFLSTEKRYESVDYDLYDEEDIWWELRSDITLPPLAPSVELIHMDHSPFTGDFSKGCLRVEGFYTHPELHYRRSDLAKIEPFDLALTYEGFGGLPNEFDHPLVASQRFYQVCKEHGIKTGWIPVRIDED